MYSTVINVLYSKVINVQCCTANFTTNFVTNFTKKLGLKQVNLILLLELHSVKLNRNNVISCATYMICN